MPPSHLFPSFPSQIATTISTMSHPPNPLNQQRSLFLMRFVLYIWTNITASWVLCALICIGTYLGEGKETERKKYMDDLRSWLGTKTKTFLKSTHISLCHFWSIKGKRKSSVHFGFGIERPDSINFKWRKRSSWRVWSLIHHYWIDTKLSL